MVYSRSDLVVVVLVEWLLLVQASSFLHLIASTSNILPYFATPIRNDKTDINNNIQILQSTVNNENEEESKESKNLKSTTIRFLGNQKISTAPIMIPIKNDENKSIISFFKEHRDLLLSEEDNVQVITSPSKIDIDNWKLKIELQKKNNADVRVDDMSDKDEVVQLQTIMQFPGLRAIASNILGTKLIIPAIDDDIFPEYQFTLLNSYNKAEGLPPAVWMYNLLSGSKKKKTSSNNMTSSFTTVKLERTNNNEIVFTTDAQLEVRINFPSAILKLIPLSTDTLEERGSMAIQKALEKQVGPNLERFRSAYIKWLEA